ncbi:6-phosphogluconolactonase [Thiovibrio sp. JS02]
MQTRNFTNMEALSRAAAEEIVSIADNAVAGRGIFTLVLTGGKTPGLLYSLLAEPPLAGRLPWKKTHLFWGDERCLPPDDPASNFFLARETLLKNGLVPLENIHRLEGEDPEPARAARRYESLLKGFFRGAEKACLPRFDCLLLGMGNDGHIASLFPGSPLLGEEKRLVAALPEPAGTPKVIRLTLTLPIINSARKVLLMISGAEKKKIFQEIAEDRDAAMRKYPAACLAPQGELLWFIGE